MSLSGTQSVVANGLTVFPTIWSRETQRNNDNAVVIAPLCSRKFQGDLKVGNAVRFSQYPSVFAQDSSVAGAVSTPAAYTRGSDIADSTHTVTTRSLVVSQQRAFREVVDDVDEFQTPLALAKGLGMRAGYSHAMTWETFLWSFAGDDLTTGGRATRSGSQGAASYYGKTSAASSVITDASAYKALIHYAADLRANNCAPGPLQVVVPPAFTEALLLESVLTGISDQATAKEAVIGGKVGKCGGLNVYETNIMIQGTHWAQSLQDDTDEALTATTGSESTSSYHIFGGNLSAAIAFVKQINRPKVTEAEKGFYVNVMQLSVFDGVLVDPSSFFDAIVY
jgi:hypothetical protein